VKSHFGNDHIGLWFDALDAPTLKTVPLKDANFTVTKLHKKLRQNTTKRVDIPAKDAYFLMFYLADTVHGDVELESHCLAPKVYLQNTICLIDIKHGAGIVLHSNLHALAFVLPRRFFTEISALTNSDIAIDLRCRRGEANVVIYNLCTALLPLFDYTQTFHPALLQHIATALCAHLLHERTQPEPKDISVKPELSICQEADVKRFMSQKYADDISVSEIAASIGMPVNDFSIRFSNSMGVGIEEWLLAIRLEQAKLLFMDRSLTVKQVAASCGFSSARTLVRNFVDATGISPTQWRKSVYH
jgi:AraC family transcriptional regulator